MFIFYKGNSISYDNMAVAREFWHKWKKLEKDQLLHDLTYET